MNHRYPFLWAIFPIAFGWSGNWAVAQVDRPFAVVNPVYFPALSLGRHNDDALTELSGLAVGVANPDILWTHNNGNRSEVHALERDGTLAGTVGLGRDVSDFEDLAMGPGPVQGIPYLYAGDIGGNRITVQILRAPEPAFPLPKSLADVDEVSLTYPDRAHHAETLMIDPLSGDVIVVTKEPSRARFYRATSTQIESGLPVVMQLIADVDFDAASGGDISSNGDLVVLRNEREAVMWKRQPGDSIGTAVVRPGHSVPVAGPPAEPEGKGIAFEPDSAAYLTVGAGKKEHLFLFRPNASGFGSGRTVGKVQDEKLDEISGCAVSLRSPDVLWVHDDGSIKEIHAIDPEGNTLATVKLPYEVEDAEDIAIGRIGRSGIPHLFLGDFGDNNSERSSIAVLRFPEPDISTWNHTVPASVPGVERLELKYPGPPADAEALLFDPSTKNLIIATKEKSLTNIFTVPAMAPAGGSPRELLYLATLDFELVSGGDMSPAGDEFVLRREDRAELWLRRPGQSLAEALALPSREIPVMTPPVEGNGEALGFIPDGSGYFTIGEEKGAPVFFFRRLDLESLVRLAPPRRVTAGWRLPMRGFANLELSVESSSDLRHWWEIHRVELDSEGAAALDVDATHPGSFFRLAR